jgi:hypothetical protein
MCWMGRADFGRGRRNDFRRTGGAKKWGSVFDVLEVNPCRMA